MDRTAADARDLSARLRYLHEAAHVMALASPETSSFLESQYSHLLAENDLIPPESRKREVCGACGTILIPGISCTVTQEQIQPSKPKKKGSKVRKPGPSEANRCCKLKIYSCLRCLSKARLQIPSSKARVGIRKPTKASAAETPMPTTAALSSAESGATTSTAAPVTGPANLAPAAANASSKKRAKARKGGLQALLANSKKETKPSTGFGLDLMDLMRSD